MTEPQTTTPARPIFIGGMFKSGTTLLRAMLGQHADIAAGPETYWFALDDKERESGSWTDSVVMIARLFDADESETLTLARECNSAEQFLDRFMSGIAARQGKSRWAEKTPGNVARVDRIMAFWPQAAILHIVRDPRDVYASLVEAQKVADAEQFVKRWMTIMPAAMEFARQEPFAAKVLTLRYEDLVGDPEPVMREVLKFVEEPWQAKVAQFSGQPGEYEKWLQVTGSASTTMKRLRKPISKERVGLWRNVLGVAGEAEMLAVADRLGCIEQMRRVIEETPSIS